MVRHVLLSESNVHPPTRWEFLPRFEPPALYFDAEEVSAGTKGRGAFVLTTDECSV